MNRFLLAICTLCLVNGSVAFCADDLQSAFATPHPDFSPVPIWWWSGDRITPEGISWQLEEIAKGGIHNVIILNLAPSGPLYGSAADDPPFLSEEWWKLFAFAVQEGKRVGIRLWFYDQLGFSGSGLQARLVRDNPGYRAVDLKRDSKDADGPANVDLTIPPGAEVVGIFVARITNRKGEDADLGTPLANVRRITDQALPANGGTVSIAVPEGKHRAEVFYTVSAGFDYQNADAGAALIDVVHGEMERRFPDELGKGIAGSFQDEFPALPRYSRRLADEMKARVGYDLTDRLPDLFDNVVDAAGPSSMQVRCDANNIAAELCEEAFFKPLHAWHQKYNMLCGYDQTVRNADPIRGEKYYIDYFKTQRHYTAPGCDMDGDIKPHQSIAELYKRPRVWIEAFHSSGWGQTMEEIATLLHPWILDGGTLWDPHAIYYSIHGSYWEWAPPDTGWRQPYFANYPYLADYAARTMHLLAQGNRVVSVGIVHPVTTVHAYTGYGDPAVPAKGATELYWEVQKVLKAANVDYIILDEDSIARAVIDKDTKQLVIDPIRLSAIVLPGTRVLTGKTLDILSQFIDVRGKIVSIGDAPEFQSDTALSKDDVIGAIGKVRGQAERLPDCARAAEVVAPLTPLQAGFMQQTMHRRIGDRDFFYIVPDKETAANGKARFDINKRNLWETPSAKGERITAILPGDGVPEFWNATGGTVIPIWNYRRSSPVAGDPKPATTTVQIDLATTAAPIIALRPATPADPIAMESEFDIVSWKRKGDTLAIQSRPRGLEGGLPDITAVFADAQFSSQGGKASAADVVRLAPPFDCVLQPTCINNDGSFEWPPSPGPVPVQIRSVSYQADDGALDPKQVASPQFDDSKWESVIASFGPRAHWTGPLSLKEGDEFEKSAPVADANAQWHPLEYSLKMGINEDPVFSSALGGKGRIPEDFLDLGEIEPGGVYLVQALVTTPPDVTQPVDTVLRIGGAARKRVFLNDTEVRFDGPADSRNLRANVQLKPGANTISMLARRTTKGRLRLFYQFMPVGDAPPDVEWIWSAKPRSDGKVRLVKDFEVPGTATSAKMVAALGGIHQIRINGKLVADQGNFDPYFTSRSEQYDIAAMVQSGTNQIEVEALDTGKPIGLMLDGLIEYTDANGKSGHVAFVSDASFQCELDGGVEPAQVLAAPAQGYMGDPATLLLYPRPHPLPNAGWLINQDPPSAPFDALIFSAPSNAPKAGWYRFRIPPGATTITVDAVTQPHLFVDGTEVVVADNGSRWTASLPNAASPHSIAALRIESKPGFEKGAALLAPIAFVTGPGKINLGSWDTLGLPHYSGGIVYSAKPTLTKRANERITLDLGRVRGSVDVAVNGKSVGTRIWHPYRFDITDAAQDGENTIAIRVLNTLGPHFGVGHPSHHVFEHHTESGIWGPIEIRQTFEAEIVLTKTP